MKKIAWLFMSVLLIVALVACSSAPANEEEMKSEATEEMTEVVEVPADSDMSEDGDMDEAEEMSEDSDMDDEMMSEDGMLELTLEELKQYNGQDGQPAYVAVDGLIYDLTDVPAWPDGMHKGNMAGNDLTDVIKNKSPHGLKVLGDKPVVGKLVESKEMEEDSMMSEDDMLELTLEELKQYNGQDGQPAYVAVDGLIYDFSDVAAWTGGKHHGNMAGNDLTDIIKNKSPHGLKVLEGKTVVGKLVE